MAESNLDEILDVLLKYNFKFNDTQNIHVYCVICKKIMTDPYTAYCGCHYCFHCLKEYVLDEEKHCPGKKKECLEEFLKIETNVFKDLNVLFKIANMNIKCPNEFCFHTSKIKNIKSHIRLCNMKAVECPFMTLGCMLEETTENNLKEHLVLDSIIHSRLLIECISHLRNDVNELRQTVTTKEKEIKEFKNLTVKYEKNIIELKDITAKNKKEINEVKFNEEKIKSEMTKYYEYVKRNNNKIIELIQSDERNKKEMKKLKEEILRITTQLIELNQKIQIKEMELMKTHKGIQNAINDNSKEYRSLDYLDNWKERKKISKIHIIEKKVGALTLNNYERTKSTEDRNVNNINKIKFVEEELQEMNCFVKRLLKPDYIWKIKDINKKWCKVGGVYYSSAFYVHQYHLYLSVNIDSLFVRYLSFYIHIAKGKNDDIVEWPMKCMILMSLYNQDSLKTHECWICNYNDYSDKSLFSRPKTDMNNGIYCGGISFVDLRDTQGLLIRDSAIVHCSLIFK